MKKRFLLIPAIGLPLLTIASTLSVYFSAETKTIVNKINAIIQTDANNYSVVTPSWTHYAVGEKLDLTDLKVTYNDPEKGAIDVTSECKLSMQNNEELKEAGEFDVTIQHNDFNSSFKIYVEKEPTEVPNTNNDAWLGDICVKFKLMSNQECVFTEYEDGEGTLEIPDYVERDGIKYFIKQIPSDWSDGENDIEGLKFKEEVRHLRKICNDAFKNTNCLDYYINNKYVNDEPNLLKFPEGLEEIGEEAFYGTDWGQNKIKGYSFPSTLKEIGKYAFAKAPYIDGDDENGILEFKSVVNIYEESFLIKGATHHDCKWVYGATIEIADAMCDKLSHTSSFNLASNFLIPCIKGENFKTEQYAWGDINVECQLIADECLLSKYISGSGILKVPDHVVGSDGKTYYVKQIPSNWSNGENSITGLEFEKDVSHLKKICSKAFANTNCLDEYIDKRDELLKFPEGLEEICDSAFARTDFGQNSIKGYSFPSTLKRIEHWAFVTAPFIYGRHKNGILEFRSIPEIDPDAFYIPGPLTHDCKWIYGNTLDVARGVHNKLLGNDNFNCSDDCLIPRLIGDDYFKIIKVKFGDITVKCGLTGDECQLMCYVEGSGTFKVRDHIEYNRKTFYLKEIPNNWSHGENNITGLEFEPNVSHLKTIGDYAFEGTNCLDYYIKNKNELLIFPEGLEEIGKYAFSNTDCGSHSIKGYSFPSTLKKIGKKAFGDRAPYIDGANNDGELHFKSIPEMDDDTFSLYIGKHNCKYIYASSQAEADKLVELFKNKMINYFNASLEYLTPKVDVVK